MKKRNKYIPCKTELRERELECKNIEVLKRYADVLTNSIYNMLQENNLMYSPLADSIENTGLIREYSFGMGKITDCASQGVLAGLCALAEETKEELMNTGSVKNIKECACRFSTYASPQAYMDLIA